MFNLKRRMLACAGCCVLILSTSIVALAAETSFSAKLPAYQGDTEVSMVRKESNYTTWTITIDSISDTGITDKVCAWTENSVTGANYSSPYNQVAIEKSYVQYDLDVPAIGDNVELNLDNPVYSSETVTVEGKWSPL